MARFNVKVDRDLTVVSQYETAKATVDILRKADASAVLEVIRAWAEEVTGQDVPRESKHGAEIIKADAEVSVQTRYSMPNVYAVFYLMDNRIIPDAFYRVAVQFSINADMTGPDANDAWMPSWDTIAHLNVTRYAVTD